MSVKTCAYRLAVLVAFCASAVPLRAEENYRIATGTPEGSYYPVGGAICALANRYADGSPPCRTATSAGSIENIEALRNGTADFGLVQADVARAALDGMNAPAMEDLRAVMVLQTEMLTILTPADSGIESFADLEGRSMDPGPEGSGHRVTMDRLISSVSWDVSATSTDGGDRIGALCDGMLDAAGFVFSHPNAAIERALDRCPLRFVPIPEGSADTIGNGLYRPTIIPATSYEALSRDVSTLGMTVSLFTTRATGNRTVEDLLARVMKDLDLLRASLPSLAGITLQSMAASESGVPLHDAADLYYQVVGVADAGACPSARQGN